MTHMYKYHIFYPHHHHHHHHHHHYQVMETLELADLADGTAGILSVEQAKRLTIGVELVASPSLIFLDEPTSGLDGHAAGIVLRVMRNISQSGR